MTSTLGLYRQLLRVSAVWPSSNRGKIMQEIRAGVPPSYQPLMHSPEPAACTRAPCTLANSLENAKHARSKQRRSFAPLPRRVSTEPERDRRRQAAEDAERSQHSGHVETRRLEASAIRPCSTPRQRQATLRAPSALGLPRSASAKLPMRWRPGHLCLHLVRQALGCRRCGLRSAGRTRKRLATRVGYWRESSQLPANDSVQAVYVSSVCGVPVAVACMTEVHES